MLKGGGVTLSATYTDDGSEVNFSQIVPYREISLKYSITGTNSVSYTFQVNTNNKIFSDSGSVVSTTSPVVHEERLTFNSGESGYIVMTVIGIDTIRTDVTAIRGTPPVISVTGIRISSRYFGTPAEDIDIDLDYGSSEYLEVSIIPDNATNKNVTWTSDNEEVATVSPVSSRGRVTANRPGRATITATTEDGGFTAKCNVKVTGSFGARSIAVNPSRLELEIGDQENITVESNFYSFADYQEISFDISDSTVISVTGGRTSGSSSTWTVTALKSGTATLTAKTINDDGEPITATCTVEVSAEPVEIPVTGINISDYFSGELTDLFDMIMTVGTDTPRILSVTVYPEDASNKNVTWSSDNERVATVTQAGEVTALYPGTANIIATTEDGNFTATCRLQVTRNGANTISLELDKTEIKTGEYANLSLRSDYALEDYQQVTWQISDESVVTVSSTEFTQSSRIYRVDALKEGTAKITASTEGADGNIISADCSITVVEPEPVNIPVTGINIRNYSSGALTRSFNMTMTVGTDAPRVLSVTVYPENATNKNVTWSSDNERVATVTQTGEVTALYPGTANIIATTEDGNFTATCRLQVTRNGANTISLELDKTEIKIGEYANLSLLSDHELEDYQEISLQISDESVVNLSRAESSGTSISYRAYGLKAGTARITATTEGSDGNTISAECSITVVEDEPGSGPGSSDPWTISPESTNENVIIEIQDTDGNLASYLWFDVWLIAENAAEDDEIGPFRIQTAENGELSIDVNNLVYSSGEHEGEKAYIEAGDYRIRYEDEATRSRYTGTTSPVKLSATNPENIGSSGGGCNALSFIPGLMILTLMFRKRR